MTRLWNEDENGKGKIFLGGEENRCEDSENRISAAFTTPGKVHYLPTPEEYGVQKRRLTATVKNFDFDSDDISDV